MVNLSKKNMKSIFSAMLAVMILAACNSNAPAQKTETPVVSESNYRDTVIDCYTDKMPKIDTAFEKGFSLQLKPLCQEQSFVADTMEAGGKGKMLVMKWKEIYYDVLITQGGMTSRTLVSKFSFGDSLAPDLKRKGLLMMPFHAGFDKKDKTVILKSFIGFPESDYGDIITFKMNAQGIVTVLSVEQPTAEN